MTAPAQVPNPSCPICHGRGWYFVPMVHMDFGPQSDFQPCPECIHVEGPTRGELICLGLVFALLLALVAWGGQ